MGRKLIDLFAFFDEPVKAQLEALDLIGINFHRESSRLDLIISGCDSLSSDNYLALAEYKILKDLDCDVKFITNDFTDASKALEIFAELIVNEITKEELSTLVEVSKNILLNQIKN